MSILSMPFYIWFFLLNALIIYHDVREKKIPNSHLLWLVLLSSIPLAYHLIDAQWLQSILSIIGGFAIATIASFGLYYYWVWSAGDAKYLLALSLFLPNFAIIPFIGNIAILTITHLGAHYVAFYGGFFFRARAYRSSFLASIWRTKRDEFFAFLSHTPDKPLNIRSIWYQIFKFFFAFLIVFVSIRLLRQYFIENIRHLAWITYIFTQSPAYGIAGVGGIMLGLLMGIKKCLQMSKQYLLNLCIRRGWTVDIWLSFSIFLFCILMSFLSYEYLHNAADIEHRLFLIFTLYLSLYLFSRFLHYSHTLVFHLGEQQMIHIDELRAWDIVDKPYLIKLFGAQLSLGAFWHPGILAPSPQKYLEDIDNPVDADTISMLQEIYRIVNRYHITQKTPDFQEVSAVKILKTFPFAAYIFLGFCATYLFGDNAFRMLVRCGWYILERLHS